MLIGKAREQATAKVKARKEEAIKKNSESPKPTGGAGTSFMRGLSSFNEGLFKIPRYLYEVASIPQNAIADLTNTPELRADYDAVASGKINPLSGIDRLGDFYKQQGDVYEARKEKFDKGIFDSLKDGDYKNAGKQLINNIAESVPSLAGMYATGGAGNAAKLGKVGKTLVNALPFASQKSNQLEETNPELPAYVRTINAGLNGLSEVVFDQEFGTKAILDDVIGSFTNEGREVAVRKAKDFVSGYLENAIKKVQPLTSGVKNALEEVTTQYSQNLVDKLTIDPDKDVFEGLADAAILGGTIGTAIQGVGTINGVINSKRKNRLAEVVKRREEIVNDLDNPNLPDDIKGDLMGQLEKENDKIGKISDDAEARLSTLPESEQNEALEAQERIEALEASLNTEGVSEGTKERIQQQIEREQDKLDVLSETSDILFKEGQNNAISQQETNEIPLQPDAGISGEVEQGIPESGLQEITNGVTPEEVQNNVQEVTPLTDTNVGDLNISTNNLETGLIQNTNGTTFKKEDVSKFEKLGYSQDQINNFSQNEAQEIISKNIENPNVESTATILPNDSKTQDPEVSGIKKALVSDKIIASVNLDKISDKDMQDLGKQLIETGEIDPKAIVDEIAGVKGPNILGGSTDLLSGEESMESKGSKRALQPKEVVALIHYKTTLDNQRRELLIERNKLFEQGESTASVDSKLSRLEDDINSYDRMSVITAQQQSLAFRLRKGLLDRDYNLVTQIEQYKKTNGGEIPAEVEAKFKALDKELTEVKKKLAEAEKRALEAEEKQSIENIKEDVVRSKKRPSKASNSQKALKAVQNLRKIIKAQNYSDAIGIVGIIDTGLLTIEASIKTGMVVSKAIDEGVAYIKKKLKEKGIDTWEKEADFRKDVTDEFDKQGVEVETPKPYVKNGELVVPPAYIRDLVEQGITDINDLSEAVRQTVATDLPDITVREVRDAITRYGKTVNQTADQLKRQINEAKRLGSLYSQLEDLQIKGSRVKTIREKNIIGDKERELKRQIKILENGLPRTPDEIRLDNRKRYLDKFIKERQDRLATKNFAPKTKPQPILRDTELSKLEAQANRVRNEYDEAHYENEQANRSTGKKIYDEAIGWGTSLQRALVAGFDASVFGVQGIIAILSQSPLKTAKSIAESWKFLKSAKYEKDFMAQLKAEPDYEIIKASGLALQYPNSKLGSVDYQLSAAQVNKIWKYFIAYPFKIFGDKVFNRVLLFNPYRATERAFTGGIDSIRLQMFRDFKMALEQQGITYESNPEQYKIAANAVNNMTFRGRLRTLEPIAKELSVVLFSPRKVTATLSLTNPAYWIDMGMKSPTVAKSALLKMATFISVATTITLAVKAFREDDEEDENPDVFNPLSSDYMKLKIGNTRLDFFGGLNQNVVLFAREWTGDYKSTSSSKSVKLGSNSFIPTRADLAGRFIANKFAPTTSLVYKWADQSKGKEIDWEDEGVQSVTPMWNQARNELFKEHPSTMANFLFAMAFAGFSVNTYGGAEFLEEGKDDKYRNLLLEKGASFSPKTRASIEVIDDKTLEKRGVTKEEYEKFKKTFGDYIKKDLSENFSTYKNMTVDEFESKIQSLKIKATKEAKFELTGVDDKIDKIEYNDLPYELPINIQKERLQIINEYLKENKTDLEDNFKEGGLSDAEIKTKIRNKANAYSKSILVEKYLDEDTGRLEFDK